MGIYERIKSLCKLRGINVKELESELGFARSSLWKIDTITPSSEKVRKIAEYFGVTQDYILTGDAFYGDEGIAKAAQEMFNDPDMRTLYDLKEKMGEKRFRAHIEFMRKMYEEDNHA